MSASWLLVSMYLIWSWGPNWFHQTTNQEQTLWVLETCLIVGLLPFMIILITASLSIKDVQHSFLTRRMHVWGNKINIIQITNLSKNFLSRWRCGQVSLYLFTLIRIFVKNSNVQIPHKWLNILHHIDLPLRFLISSNINRSPCSIGNLRTCLIVPLMIILITASLSSNTYNKASWREDWTFEGTESMSFITSIFYWNLWCLWTSLSSCPDLPETRETFPRTETIRSHHSRAGKPSNLNPVSKEMISDSVELWEQQFVSYTSSWLERTCGCRTYTMFHLK